jgi:hypothetical protein
VSTWRRAQTLTQYELTSALFALFFFNQDLPVFQTIFLWIVPRCNRIILQQQTEQHSIQ